MRNPVQYQIGKLVINLCRVCAVVKNTWRNGSLIEVDVVRHGIYVFAQGQRQW
jgi:hypothetical protein